MNFQRWYINFLVKHPYLILFATSVFSCTCLILPFTLKSMNLPNFQDPQMGFSTRGTTISNRLTAWHNLQNEVRPSGSLVKNPKEYLLSLHQNNISSLYEPSMKIKGGKKPRKKHKKKHNKYKDHSEDPDYHKEHNKNDSGSIYGKVVTNEKNTTDRSDYNKWLVIHNMTVKHTVKEDKFCGEPDEKYVHLIITSANNENLFTLKNIKTLCKLQTILMNSKNALDICISNDDLDGECCEPWSLPNYIAGLVDKDSCLDITENDMNQTKALLEECAIYFHQNVNCVSRTGCDMAVKCLKHDAVYNILNYLTSTTFYPLHNMNSSKQKLEETVLFLPIAASIASLPVYNEILQLGNEFEGLKIVAMDFGIKSSLFDEYLIRDAWLMGLGASFIFFCTWVYTTSLFLTLAAIIGIVFAMADTYFLYEVVYEIGFFPFMNMLSIIICIGIGTDNAFILCKIWHMNKNDQSNDNDVSKIMHCTFDHAFKSMFVTTLTTAAAFWGSSVSSVTAVACFSIFAGTVIVVNFVLTTTWFPACLIIWEQICRSNSFSLCTHMALERLFCCFRFRWSLSPACCRCFSVIWNGKKEFIINAVIKLRYFWMLSFTALAVASSVIVFVTPGLELPNTTDFQLFRSNHPFEMYDFVYKYKFRFKKLEDRYDEDDYKMPLRFIWGVLAVDNGNHLNPTDFGSLELDYQFDMADPASQIWLRDFCRNIMRQPFFRPFIGVALTSCFIDTFITSMNRQCYNFFTSENLKPCCNVSSFPFERAVFSACILDEIKEIYRGPAMYVHPKTAGLVFSKENSPVVKAVVVEFNSNITFSMSYETMEDFYSKVTEFTQLQMSTAPPNMQNGFFISDLSFYDLQHELSRGTKTAIFGSMVLASVVLVLSTLNPLISAMAIVTITFSIITTIAGLILCGWTLNILESVAISAAIGLAVDSSLHYCINYRLCPSDLTRNREDATRFALSCLMGPSFMAGLTTAAAGFFMLFSLILSYFQIGLFLVLVMTISWLYATFFLGSLLATLGPTQNFCQFTYRGLCRRLLRGCRNESMRQENNKPTASTSSITDLDKVSFIKRDTPSIKKKSSKEPYVRYTQSQGLADQSPSSNATIVMADVTAEDN